MLDTLPALDPPVVPLAEPSAPVEEKKENTTEERSKSDEQDMQGETCSREKGEKCDEAHSVSLVERRVSDDENTAREGHGYFRKSSLSSGC